MLFWPYSNNRVNFIVCRECVYDEQPTLRLAKRTRLRHPALAAAGCPFIDPGARGRGPGGFRGAGRRIVGATQRRRITRVSSVSCGPCAGSADDLRTGGVAPGGATTRHPARAVTGPGRDPGGPDRATVSHH